jgi:hypothetical protein
MPCSKGHKAGTKMTPAQSKKMGKKSSKKK